MVPQKGKALYLLRTLNDLLRRLSKMGSNTIFCGRILTFLSTVFPLGERSGVNLRGEYGPTWEVVGEPQKSNDLEAMKVDEPAKKADDSTDKVDVDEKKTQPSDSTDKKEEFYHTFWSLQLYFSKPPLFANPGAFDDFRDGVNKVLPVIKEATAKERAMMGSRASNHSANKRKRESEHIEEISTSDYFFAKFLTSPELLDLEVSYHPFSDISPLICLPDRRYAFPATIPIPTTKETWSTPRNRSLHMDFTLGAPEVQWVQETINKAFEELRQTAPNGRAFAETVATILEREKSWVKWKNELCQPFDKEAWSVEIDGRQVGLEEATREQRQKLREDPKEWEWALGSEPLTDIWAMGYRELSDLAAPFHPGDVKDFVMKIKREDTRIEMRKKFLARTAERRSVMQKAVSPAPPPVVTATEKEDKADGPAGTPSTGSTLHPSLPAKPGSTPAATPAPTASTVPAPAAPTPVPAPASVQPSVPAPVQPAPVIVDEQIAKYEEVRNKTRWGWLALRTARDQHLQHFGKIGAGDIELLAQEIEKEKEEREKAAVKDEETAGATAGTGAEEVTAGSPMVGTQTTEETKPAPEAVSKPPQESETPTTAKDAEGDVKMSTQ
ncbi:THO complex transcription elongation factor-domain-containing [Salix suchowensis]|nr:THO complex transcription elongation factor-domain-containing [Salix suchowensis]